MRPYFKCQWLIVFSLGFMLSGWSPLLAMPNIPWSPPIESPASDQSGIEAALKDNTGRLSFAEMRLQQLARKQSALLEGIEQRADLSEDTVLQQRVQELVASYESLIASNPDFLLTYLVYGKLLRRVGQDQRAYAIFRKADELDTTLPVVKQQLAALLAENGQFEQALPFALEAISLSPQTAVYHYQFAELLYVYRDLFVEKGLFDRATLESELIQAFDQAVSLDPYAYHYRLRRAKAYFHLESAQPDKALAYWNAALPDAEPGLETEAIQLHRADLMVDLGRRQEALAIAQGVTHSQLQFSRQQVLDKLSDLEE